MRELLRLITTSGTAVKRLFIAGLIILVGNLVLIFVLSNVLTGNRVPERALKPLSELEYQNVFSDNYQQCEATSGRLLDLMEQRAWKDTKWRQRLEMQVSYMKVLVSQAEEIVPPESHKVAHFSYMKAINEFSWAADNLIPSVNEENAQLSKQCVDRIIKGQDYMIEAAQRIQQGF